MSELTYTPTNTTISTGTATQNATYYQCPSCGVWISGGLYHICNQYQRYVPPTWYNYPVYYNAAVSNVQRFRGRVKRMKDLPSAKYRSDGSYAQVGDAYFVEDLGVLVVRANNGWHTFDDDH